ncbi:MAG TPA: hypothetical protein VEX65_12985 [Flavisolibacter sp.]|nr:hypothetical protein [Flavisolibacter sp.]
MFFLVLLFNFFGYRLVIAYLEKGNNTVMEQKLDRFEYNEDELVSIKTKLHLPYYASSPVFERTYGSVTIDDVVYEYVQRRVFNDTLELLCLPNNAKTKLQDIKNELTGSTADGKASVPVKKAPSTLKISFPDFCQFTGTTTVVYEKVSATYALHNVSLFLADFSRQQERPPQAI